MASEENSFTRRRFGDLSFAARSAMPISGQSDRESGVIPIWSPKSSRSALRNDRGHDPG
jgi:hypothetical protein